MNRLLVADTTFLVDLAVGDRGAVEAAVQTDATEEILATTFINVHEFLMGNAARPAKARERGQRLLSRLLVLPGDQRSAALSSQAGVELMARGQPVSTVDLLIAGIALRDGAILLTRDTDFGRIPGLATQAY